MAVRKAFVGAALVLASCGAQPALAQTVGYGVTTTHAAGTTSATAGVFTQVLPVAGGVYARRNCQITNTSTGSENIDVGPTASATTSRPLAAGATFSCSDGVNVLLDQIFISGSAASQTYAVWVEQ